MYFFAAGGGSSEEFDVMTGGSDRLVRRIFGQLQMVGLGESPVCVSDQDVIKLEARLKSFNDASHSLEHVELSPYIVREGSTVFASRLGGECVATDV